MAEWSNAAVLKTVVPLSRNRGFESLFLRQDAEDKNIFCFVFGRDAGVVERGGLENRCSAIAEPGVRIPLSPQKHLRKITALAQLFFLRGQAHEKACFFSGTGHSKMPSGIIS